MTGENKGGGGKGLLRTPVKSTAAVEKCHPANLDGRKEDTASGL